MLKTRKTGKTEPKAELPQITNATAEFEEALNVVLKYVEDVLADKVAPDNSIGRNLLKLVQAVPKMSQDELDTMMSANIKVSFLSFDGIYSMLLFTEFYLINLN